MGSVNVNRNVTDIFYRYKMPRIAAKVEGKGNGIKTVIVNMAEVAKALGRPATYPTKYFGCELGAQTQFDHKNERFIVNGSHNAAKLQDLLDGFIRKYVLCPECDNPETDLLVSTKKGTISQGCKACGFHGPLEVHHKVNTFIIKNPPNLDPAAQGSSLTEGKRSKRSTKKGGENGNDTSENVGDISLNIPIVTAVSTVPGTIVTPTAVMPSIDSLDSIKVPIITPTVTVTQDDDDDTTWSADISAEAVRARMQDLTDGAKTMTISDDNDKPEKERLDIFYELVKKRRDGGELENVQVHKELAMEADRLDVSQKAPLVLAELLFGQNIILEVRKHRNLFLRFTHNNAKAQRYLMGGLEQIIALHSAKLLDKVGGILKLFYDNDILEEKAILDWSSKVSKKYVAKEISEKIHEKATPFILWLQEAEEEESTSDEDDSDVEIKYDDRVRASDGLKKEQPPSNNSTTIRNKKDGGDDEGDEIDIDDI